MSISSISVWLAPPSCCAFFRLMYASIRVLHAEPDFISLYMFLYRTFPSLFFAVLGICLRPCSHHEKETGSGAWQEQNHWS